MTPQLTTELTGSTLVLLCHANGDRPITYYWMFDGNRLQNSTKYRLSPTSGHLTVTNIIISDAGLYTCTATNPYIVDARQQASNASVNVTVVEKSKQPNHTTDLANSSFPGWLFLLHPLSICLSSLSLSNQSCVSVDMSHKQPITSSTFNGNC